MSTLASKVQAVLDFASPTTESGVRIFLGLTGYYCWFIKDYADHIVAITEATKKAAPDQVEWSQTFQEIEFLQHAHVCNPTLTLLAVISVGGQREAFLLPSTPGSPTKIAQV